MPRKLPRLSELNTTWNDLKFTVLVSANAEWAAVKSLFPTAAIEHSPYGEYFCHRVDDERVLFFHGGFGKVAAAASTQYVIDHFKPAYLINIGTCGGVEGRIDRFGSARTFPNARHPHDFIFRRS